MAYVNGGYVGTQLHYSESFSDDIGAQANQTSTDSQYHSGWALGGGAEVALTDHWSIRPEYLFTNLIRQLLKAGT
jgi:opacity protein-like surface antigen